MQRPEAADEGDMEGGESGADRDLPLAGRHPETELRPPLDEHEQTLEDGGVQAVEIVDEQGGRLARRQLEQRLERVAMEGGLAAGISGAAATPPDAAMVSPLVGVQVGQQRRPTGAGRPEDQQARVVVQHVPSGSQPRLAIAPLDAHASLHVTNGEPDPRPRRGARRLDARSPLSSQFGAEATSPSDSMARRPENLG